MIREHAEQLQEVLSKIIEMEPVVDALSAAILTAFKSGKKLMTCGNGGSASEAAHFAEEFTGRFFRERDSLPGMCLAADGALITCIGNDYGYDEVFARQVAGLGQPGDVLAVFSSSGNSENLLRALQVAKSKGIHTAAFLGKGGGRTAGVADFELLVPSDSTMRSQEMHLFLLHMVCEKVERAFLKLDD
ncbi:MAG TPA: SIS domain-containing protein [Capsulimonadaceae bacterium]|jgi:D-sedoheptulose 7-phosphate isomerase